jgi:hypothetical protein
LKYEKLRKHLFTGRDLRIYLFIYLVNYLYIFCSSTLLFFEQVHKYITRVIIRCLFKTETIFY